MLILSKGWTYIGDMVYVEKGGEIIPKITGVDKDARGMLIGEKSKIYHSLPGMWQQVGTL